MAAQGEVWLSEKDVVAIDCEMVGVEPASGNQKPANAVCRVSVVCFMQDQGCRVQLDTWVEVPGRVVDYRTEITGINEETFARKQKMSFFEARARIRTIIDGRIVVGHALWNDFKALKLDHPSHLTRDTSWCSLLRPAWDPDRLPSLRLLAKTWLHIDMHEGGKHDSVEDATIALRLYDQHQDDWERLYGNVCLKGHDGCFSIWVAVPENAWWDEYGELAMLQQQQQQLQQQQQQRQQQQQQQQQQIQDDAILFNIKVASHNLFAPSLNLSAGISQAAPPPPPPPPPLAPPPQIWPTNTNTPTTSQAYLQHVAAEQAARNAAWNRFPFEMQFLSV